MLAKLGPTAKISFWNSRGVDVMRPYLIASEILTLRLCSPYLRDSTDRWCQARIFSKRCEEALCAVIFKSTSAKSCLPRQ